jgi:hypothetical protein
MNRRDRRRAEAQRRKTEMARQEEVEQRVTYIIDALPAGLADFWFSLEKEFAAEDDALGHDTRTRVCLAFNSAARIILRELVERDFDIRLPQKPTS